MFPLWPCINLILGTPTSCFKNGIGTRLQACAWAHANPMVVEHITLMTTMSDYRQQFIDFKFHDRLSIADAIVLVQFLGLTKAAAFISEVDPWSYPHDDTPATLTVRKYVHCSVDLAAHAGKTIARFTDASITEYLCSPLLVKKGDRPSLVLKPKSERSKSSPKSSCHCSCNRCAETNLSTCRSSNH